MAFNRPTLLTLIRRALADLKAALPGTDPFLRRSVLGSVGRMCAGLTHGLYGYLSYLADQVIYDTAEGSILQRWASIWGVQQKVASQAVRSVTFTGLDGSTVAAASVWQTLDGVQFTVNADAVIVAGTVTTSLTAVLGGTGGNLQVGATLSALNPIAGVDGQATVAAEVSDGADVETDDELRPRFLARVQQPPHGGSDPDYVAWALEIAGVTRAWCYPLELGIGTVTVRFVMDDAVGGPIPDGGTVTAVQAHIDAVRPVTADVTVVAPVADALAMTIQISPNTAEIQTAITAELQDLLLREGQPGGTLLISQIREAVTSATDAELDSIVVIPAANVVSPTGHIPVLGVITFQVIP